MTDQYIANLVQYGIDSGLISEEERIYSTNLILNEMDLLEYDETTVPKKDELENILKGLLDDAVKRGICEDSIVHKDLFDAKLMNCITPRPSEVIGRFNSLYKEDKKKATDFFYKFSQDTDYIRRYRICKDIKWVHKSEYGDIDITINLSKPEKDPKAIAAAGAAKASGYPKCLLCREAEGYAGNLKYPGRSNHRIIPLELAGDKFGFQYSPYVYYNEHCILLNYEHVPMVINRKAFMRLIDFVKQFPHYIIGSNADIPIVGGSILSHDHYQGGNYGFAMAKAPIEREIVIKGYEDIKAGIVKWPLSVIRIESEDDEKLIELADHILKTWRGYTDEEATIIAYTGDTPHNTITPVARMKDGRYQLDLVLRNNLTSDEFPLGIYHPHQQHHNIKKENIGLVEVMGLAILPARLKSEMAALSRFELEGRDLREDEALEKHADWFDNFKDNYPDMNKDNIDDILRTEIGRTFVRVLEDAGVYKCTAEGREYFIRFIESL